MTSYPRILREGRSAAPIGPDAPLTRIREIMADRMQLYQFPKRHNKLAMNLKTSKRLKWEKTRQPLLQKWFAPW
jgi:hypothetical protein